MNYIKSISESFYFKVLLTIIAFMFISFGISGLLNTNNSNILATVNGFEFNTKYFFTDLSFRLKIQTPRPTEIDFQNSLNFFTINKNLNTYNLTLRDQDLTKIGFSSKEINQIQDIELRDYLLDYLQNNVISNAIFYTPNGKLAKELFEITQKTQIEIYENTFDLSSNSKNNNDKDKKITLDEAKSFYEKNPHLFTIPKNYNFEYSIISNEKDIEKIEEDIFNSITFKKLLNKYNLNILPNQDIKKFNLSHAKTLEVLKDQDLYNGYISYVLNINELVDVEVNNKFDLENNENNFLLVHIKNINDAKILEFDYDLVQKMLLSKYNFEKNMQIVSSSIKSNNFKNLNNLLDNLDKKTNTKTLNFYDALAFILHFKSDMIFGGFFDKNNKNEDVSEFFIPNVLSKFYKFKAIKYLENSNDISNEEIEEEGGEIFDNLQINNDLNQKILNQLLNDTNMKAALYLKNINQLNLK